MKIQTFSIITGTATCNASCPYCISKMTPKQGVTFKEPEVNWRNFRKACRLAKISNVSTILLTGKGEPTLYPKQITKFLKNMKEFEFPIIELQTNGIIFLEKEKKFEKYLKEWYDLGLTMIVISIIHYKKEKNKEIFTPYREYIDLEKLIEKLHEIGFSVRLSCTLVKGYIDTQKEVEEIINKAKEWRVEQLSLRKMGKPEKSDDKKIFKWTEKNALNDEEYDKISNFIKNNGNKLMTVHHGAVIYDINEQNVCLTDALTIAPETDNLRQIIFFPDGHLRYDWQFKGAILI